MLSVSEARERILREFKTVESESIPLDHAAGRVLAEDIISETDLPRFDNSSVDGFALRSEDSRMLTNLSVVGDIRAGTYLEIPIEPGESARIMTGAPLPKGADAVIKVEDTDFSDRDPGRPAPRSVTPHKAVSAGENVRRQGDDLHQGDCLLDGGTRLRAQELGLLAMVGMAIVPIYRKVRMALLSSGDELVPLDVALTPGKIHDSNTITLAALSEKAGLEVIQLGVSKDDQQDIQNRLERAVEAGVDVIVSSAGVSVGAFDYVKPVVESKGELNFWKVDMRPGKPLAFGRYSGIPFFGLPGNPVSAFVGFKVFLQPALDKLSGLSQKVQPKQKAILMEPVESDGRESYLRAIVTIEDERQVARLSGHQGSGNIFSLVRANALLIVPSGVKSLPAGKEVEIWPLD